MFEGETSNSSSFCNLNPDRNHCTEKLRTEMERERGREKKKERRREREREDVISLNNE